MEKNKKMKALIMAAGYGTRLEPLTIAVPKPMVPLVTVPTMQLNIELLKKYGFKEIIANIHYHPEQIQNYFVDGHDFGVKLSYSYEKELLGTAGGVKRMAKLAEIKETFLVLSSDALTDINLNNIIKFHKEKKSLFTIALARVENVSQFGVVIQDKEEKIIGFQEKPKQEDAKSNMVNAGIYIIEPEILAMMPDGFYDFGKELFPKLVKEGAPIYGYPMVEYWSDVGCIDKYIEANYDAMRGHVRVKIPGKKIAKSTWIGDRGKIAKNARFEGTVVIGDRCHIHNNVYIRDSIIGDKCVIEEGAAVLGSVIWDDTVIKKDAQVVQSVVGSWCEVGKQVVVKEGSVIANRSMVRDKVEVAPHSRLQPNSII
jgi:mannose-1-phosphate guanylyltransferase